MADPRSSYRYDVAANRYRGAGGRFIPRAEIRGALDIALENAGKRAQALTDQLRQRAISTADWERGMRGVVKETQLYSGALAKGGWGQMAAADFGRVGQRVREQYGRLNAFAAQLESGAVPLDGRAGLRAQLYAQAGRGTFHAVERLEMEVRGFDEEHSVRHASESCAECVAAEAAGWVPLGTLPPVGERQCLGNCKCGMLYRNAATGARAA